MSDAVAVTTRLYLGPPEAAAIWPDMIPVETAADAVTVIMSGHSALLPELAWEVAEEVLRRFGASEEHIAFQLGSAGAKPQAD
jgi:hypothetical protein